MHRWISRIQVREQSCNAPCVSMFLSRTQHSRNLRTDVTRSSSSSEIGAASDADPEADCELLGKVEEAHV